MESRYKFPWDDQSLEHITDLLNDRRRDGVVKLGSLAYLGIINIHKFDNIVESYSDHASQAAAFLSHVRDGFNKLYTLLAEAIHPPGQWSKRWLVESESEYGINRYNQSSDLDELLSERRKRALICLRPDLMELINIDESKSMLWDRLVSKEVIDQMQCEAIKKTQPVPFRQVAELLDHVSRGTNRRYDNFLLALAEDNQFHVVGLIEKTENELDPGCDTAEGEARERIPGEFGGKSGDDVHKVSPTVAASDKKVGLTGETKSENIPQLVLEGDHSNSPLTVNKGDQSQNPVNLMEGNQSKLDGIGNLMSDVAKWIHRVEWTEVVPVYQLKQVKHSLESMRRRAIGVPSMVDILFTWICDLEDFEIWKQKEEERKSVRSSDEIGDDLEKRNLKAKANRTYYLRKKKNRRYREKLDKQRADKIR